MYMPGMPLAKQGICPLGSMTGSLAIATEASAAPVLSEKIPARTLPTPIAPHAWSSAPRQTKVSSDRPNSLAAHAATLPIAVPG
ncbi:hypothetical protein D3C80_1776500 [compost metagenome]